MNAQHWIDRYQMTKHPEGSWFKEIYRSELTFERGVLPNKYGASRQAATSIYFLLEGSEVSKFHVLQSDEIWYFHAGSSVTIHFLDPKDKSYHSVKLGNSGSEEETFQAVIPAGVIFGATIDNPDGYSLVGCMVAPGFDFADFRLCSSEELLKSFPEQKGIIDRLT